MGTFILDDVLAQLRAALERDDLTGAVGIIESLQPADQAESGTVLRGDRRLCDVGRRTCVSDHGLFGCVAGMGVRGQWHHGASI